MTTEQLHILQHTLGVDEYGQGEQYRNHFCAGGRDLDTCISLKTLGYMGRYDERDLISYPTFYATELGKKAMTEESPKPPKLTRGQKRYRSFLKADTGRSFREWIQDHKDAGISL